MTARTFYGPTTPEFTGVTEATFTGRFPVAQAASDAIANPTTTNIMGIAMVWDPITAVWMRARMMTNTDGDARTGLTAVALRAVDAGGLYDRIRGDATKGLRATPHASDLSVVVAGGANAIATLTLPAAGAGLFHYITYLHIKRVATAALAGGALLTVTTTNLGGISWRTGNQMSITVAASDFPLLIDMSFSSPWRSAVSNTATTIVGPAAGAAVSWHIACRYFTAP